MSCDANFLCSKPVSNSTMDRPRRTTRQPIKTAKVLVTSDPTPRVAKRKVDPEQRLNILLESSKSELALMELPVRIIPQVEAHPSLGNATMRKLPVLNGRLP